MGLDGTLWKRASKVHVTQIPESQTGKARGWVSRHFQLLSTERLIVYLQNADDTLKNARGVVQLANFIRVEDASTPDDTDDGRLHAFQLLPADTTSEHAAREPLILAASTASEKAAWMQRLAAAFDTGSEKLTDPPNAGGLERRLAAAYIS